MRSFQLVDKRTGEVTFDGQEATRLHPCWVCEHLHQRQSWCLIDDVRGIVICPRVESDRRIGDAGWLHHKSEASGSLATAAVTRKVADEVKVNMEQEWQKCRDRVTTADYVHLAEALGMKPIDFPVWIELGMYFGAWAFAMRDPSGCVCGVKLRGKDGAKWCMKGSRLGLIYARTFDKSLPELIVTEGESDALVAASWGFNAVARPGAKSCTTHLEAICRGKSVVLVADRDAAGMDGARMLASDLRKRCKNCTIVTPPPGVKDLRAWMVSGGSAEELAWLVRSSRGW
jgi:hypothetical protein